MTMYTLPNFCRVCLKYDKNLIDLEHIENEPNETLMSKLQQCVSEVEWKVFKPLLCHPCIKRLNIAYTFKKQCVQSATMLKSYMALLSKNKSETEQTTKSDMSQSSAYMMLPNQKYIKIVVGPQNQNTFQNVFLNVVPTTTISPVSSDKTSKDNNNQNVFLNINNTIQKFVPTSAESPPKNVSQLLTESKSEELSVEIDPMDFGVGDGGSDEDEEEAENGFNDWEDVISAMKVTQKPNGKNTEPKTGYTNFVPILPKQSDDKMDFSNSGEHFLSSQLYPTSEYMCEQCQKHFTSRIFLRNHIKNFHMGKYPYKCDYCSNEFIVRSEYEACMKYHKQEEDPLSTSLTLNDFKNDSEKPISNMTEELSNSTDLTCDICHRQFNSPSGMLRHKVRKHNQKTKKKYFIKGMKNAKCDICNREFSTQSYMQLHRKLHLRDDIGYKYKVLGKSKYVKNENGDQKIGNKEMKQEKNDNHENSNNKEESMEIEVKEETIVDIKEEERDDDESSSDNGSEN